METLYCSRCNLFTEFRVQQTYETHQVRGEEITILTDVAYCVFLAIKNSRAWQCRRT